MKRKTSPDRRGMGAQSDFIAERFVPSANYIARQRAVLRQLIAAGSSPESVQDMFLIPLDLPSPGEPDPE